MPNSATFSASTPGSKVVGTVTDKLPVIPGTPPTGITAIGPRITPNFINVPWSADNTYQYYDVVQVAGTSYIARKAVPTGIQIDNTEYWIKWADPNAQMAELDNKVNMFQASIDKKYTSYKTVQDMINDESLKQDDSVITLGYNSVGDNGNGTYLIKENGVESYTTIKLKNGLYAYLITDNYIKPEQLGAYGDNIHNDTVYIQYAINNFNNIILSSNYLCDTIYINRNNISFYGEYIPYNKKPSIYFTENSGIIFDNSSRYILINGINFHGYAKTSNGISFNENNNNLMIKIKDCIFSYFKTAIDGNTNNPVLWMTYIESCRFENCETGIITNSTCFITNFNNVYFDNVRNYFNSYINNIENCNFGLSDDNETTFGSGSITTCTGCNFEVDTKFTSGAAIYMQGYKCVYNGCFFISGGNENTVFFTATSLNKMIKFNGCRGNTSKFDDNNMKWWNSVGVESNIGSICGDSTDLMPEFTNSNYFGMVKPSEVSIIKANDSTAYAFPKQAIRYSTVRNEIEYYKDNVWVDAFGNNINRGNSITISGAKIEHGTNETTESSIKITCNNAGTGHVYIDVEGENTYMGVVKAQSQNAFTANIYKINGNSLEANSDNVTVKWTRIIW